jgi:hypothetical protein
MSVVKRKSGDLSTQVVITPAQYKSGEMIYPYEKAK